jgi:hypothetical protein
VNAAYGREHFPRAVTYALVHRTLDATVSVRTMDNVGIKLSYLLVLLDWLWLKHADSMRRGRKRQRKTAERRLLRQLDRAERAQALVEAQLVVMDALMSEGMPPA